MGLGFQPHAKQEYVQKIEAVTFPVETDVNQSLNLLLDDVSVAHMLESWSTSLCRTFMHVKTDEDKLSAPC